jgi:hypothetical protein
MDRLTRHFGNAVLWSGDKMPTYQELLERLVAYEDTEMTPQEISDLKFRHAAMVETADDLLADSKDWKAENARLRAENDDLFYKLVGVMHSVDKWLDGDELKQDEVNRAATMREKTLKIVEQAQKELEQVRAERDAAVEAVPHICNTCKFETSQYVSVDNEGPGFWIDDCAQTTDLGPDDNDVCQDWAWRGPQKEGGR